MNANWTTGDATVLSLETMGTSEAIAVGVDERDEDDLSRLEEEEQGIVVRVSGEMDGKGVGDVGSDMGGDPLAGVLQSGEKDATRRGGVCVADGKRVNGIAVE